MPGREVYSLHPDWRFHLGDIAERNFDAIHRKRFQAPEWIKAGNHGLSKPGFPDTDWQGVDLPHDFVVEAPFSPDANTVHGSKRVGVGWYRKTFNLPASDRGRRILLEFDGVYRDAQVWMNGHFIGRHLSGYTSFSYDVSEVCRFGDANTLAVRADATQFELWSYEGGGIYRDVRLVKVNPVHVPTWGTFVRTDVDGRDARVSADITIRNDHRVAVACRIHSEVVDAEGRAVAVLSDAEAVIGPDAAMGVQQVGTVARARRWDLEDPYLYRVLTTVRVDDTETDCTPTRFGIRQIRFDAKEGFFLNGCPIKLKGVCEHQDHAGTGAAIPDRLYAWRLERLKEMGCNALRTAHNPPSPALLDACDSMGILVVGETRMVGASHEALDQLTSLIRRDRNHPCVILWSLGNEEMAIQDNQTGIVQFRRMQERAHRLDPTRLTTYAMNCDWLATAGLHDRAGFRFDVFGANYTFTPTGVDAGLYDLFHRRYPDWPLVGSETGGSASTRGLYDQEQYQGRPLLPGTEAAGYDEAVYTNPSRRDMVTAYNEMLTPWGTPIDQVWQDCAKRPFLAGTFLWTGFDYRGETYPFGWPAVVTRYGLLDLCGFPKDAYFYYQAWWRPDCPMLHLFPHWNWDGREGQSIDVRCYSNCAEVELRLNDRLIGTQTMDPNGFLQWDVPYQAGCLEAWGFDAAGEPVCTQRVETTGAPKRIRLQSDRATLRADGRDLAVVTVAVLDAHDRVVPTADNLITFDLEGPATAIGVGNGNPTSHEPDKAERRHAFHGLCQVILRSTSGIGTIRLRASGEGLESATRDLVAEAAECPPVIPSLLTSARTPSRTANPVEERL